MQNETQRLSLCMLASGSRGNAIYICDGTTSVLFDAGLSGAEIERRMQTHALIPSELDALVVSHEHTDHIQGVGVLSRRYDLPVYISNQSPVEPLGNIKQLNHFKCGTPFCLNDLVVRPFATSHDAQDPVGFTVTSNGTRLGIATDLGIVTAMVKEHLKDCHALVIEANHDMAMLENGPYPWYLKQRIKSRLGHISNKACKELLMEIKHPHLRRVILAHLSETNNAPEVALREVGQALSDDDGFRLDVAMQHVCGELIAL